MTIPIVFQAKAMTTVLLIISAAFAAVFAAVFLVSFDVITTDKVGRLIGNETESAAVVIAMPGGAVGPESFAFDGSGGGPYTGVSDGRIIRWLANESRWVDFAVTSPERDDCEGPHDHTQREPICGRPLGLKFNDKTGDLYIADAYMGLLVVGPEGGLASPLAKEVDGLAFGFTNSLDIDPNSEVVYFTDSSTRFRRRDYVSVIIIGDNTGRLMKFDLKMRQTTCLLDRLHFPNGVALSKDGDFLLFAETTTCRLYKFWLKTSKAGNLEEMAQLPGFPDNIKRNRNGEFWVGINSRRGRFLEWIISNPWIGDAIAGMVDATKIRSRLARLMEKSGMGIRLDRDGNVVEVVDCSKGKRWKEVSEVCEEDGNLWIGSVSMSYVVRDKIPTSSNLE